MSRGVNAKHVFTFDVRDTNPHLLPSGSGEAAKWDKRTWNRTLVKLVNTLNQAINVDVQITTDDDPNFAEPVTLQTINVPAGANREFVIQDGSSYVRASATASVAPASGSLKVVFQNERFGAA